MKLVRLKVPNGEVVSFVKLGDLAKMCGKKPVTLRKWLDKQWLPESNYNMPPIVLTDGLTRKGARVYSFETAAKMAEIIKTVKRGEEINNEVIRQLHLLIKEEKQKYSQQKQ